MTREVAIKAIQDFIGWFKEDSLIRKALEMAIQALEQPKYFFNGSDELIVLDEFKDIPIMAYSQGKQDALSQEPCDDAISRDAAINIASLHCLTIDETVKALEQLPSVTQKSGKWIDREVYDADRWKCSVCGRTEQYKENYCPNCGAKMESEDKE